MRGKPAWGPSLRLVVALGRPRFVKQLLDLFDVVERVVEEKLELGNYPSLMTDLHSEELAYLFILLFDQVDDRLRIRGSENAEINLCDAEVRAYANIGDRNERLAVKIKPFALEKFSDLFLEEPIVLLLSRGIHRRTAFGAKVIKICARMHQAFRAGKTGLW
jgi:hypothetical protein